MASLLARNLVFTVLQPGLVTVLFPYLLLRNTDHSFWPDVWTILHYAGFGLMLFGVSILLWCVSRFVVEGKGTISPLDPTRKLIAAGVYRFSRNPMYIGVMLLLMGEAIFWQSLVLAAYAGIVFLAFNLFIILHEEPRLKRDFGDEYERYFQKVRRWL